MIAQVLLPAIALMLAACQSQFHSSQSEAQSQSTPSGVQAYQADAFIDSIGVATHLSYTDTNYFTAWPSVLQDLQSLGVRHVRDGYYNWTAEMPFYAEHRQLASAGIHTTYLIPYDASTTAAAVAGAAQQLGDMEAVEGPNECDMAGNCGGTAAQSMANMLSFLPTVKASGEAANVPVLGPSFSTSTAYSQAGNIASEMTENNLHVYFGGRNPGTSGWGDPDANGNNYGSIPFWLDQANIDAPGVPVTISETGYMMFTQPQQYTIPPATGASYIPRTLLLAYMQGVKRTYMYELLDEKSSPGYGLIDENMNPKPAFNAVRNLIATLSDKGASFTAGKLDYSLTGGDSTLKQALFQKRDGSFWLVLWLEQSSYDVVNLQDTPVTSENLTLQLNGDYQVTSVGTIENTGDLSWTSANPAASSETIPVSDAVTIVKIVNGK